MAQRPTRKDAAGIDRGVKNYKSKPRDSKPVKKDGVLYSSQGATVAKTKDQKLGNTTLRG